MADSMIPVRACVYDADFDPSLIPLIVKLDGVEVEQVIGYDIEAGTVEHAVTDESGNVVVSTVTDSILTETLHGVVTVERGPAPDAI